MGTPEETVGFCYYSGEFPANDEDKKKNLNNKDITFYLSDNLSAFQQLFPTFS